jgi:hypothetical protein
MNKNIQINSERQITDDESRNYNDITDEQMIKKHKKGLINLADDRSLELSSESDNDEDISMTYAYRADFNKPTEPKFEKRPSKKGFEMLGQYIFSDNSEIICEPKKDGIWATSQFDVYIQGDTATHREEIFTLQSQSSQMEYNTFRQSYQKLADKCEMVEKEYKELSSRYNSEIEAFKDFYFKVFGIMSRKNFIKFNKSESILNENNQNIMLNVIESQLKMPFNLYSDLVEEFSYISNKRAEYEEVLKTKDLEIKNLKKEISDYEFEIDTLKQKETLYKIEIETFLQNEKNYHMEFDKYKSYENQKLDSERLKEKEKLQKLIEKESSYLKEIEELKVKELSMLSDLEKLKNNNLMKYEEDLKTILFRKEAEIEELKDIINKNETEEKGLKRNIKQNEMDMEELKGLFNKSEIEIKGLKQIIKQNETDTEELKKKVIKKDKQLEQMRLLETSKQSEIDSLLKIQQSKDKEIDRLKQIEILRELEVERISKSKHSNFSEKKPPTIEYKKTKFDFNILSSKKHQNIITSNNHFTVKSSRGAKIDNNNNLLTPITNRSSRKKDFNNLISMITESFNIKSRICKIQILDRYQINSFTLDCHIKRYNSETQTKLNKVTLQ